MNHTLHTERLILRRLVLDALRAGYALTIDDGGEEEEMVTPAQTARAVLDALFSVDCEHLLFSRDGRRVGWVLLVHGNGDCVISDYTTNLEPVLTGANALAERLGA